MGVRFRFGSNTGEHRPVWIEVDDALSISEQFES
jgi:hypothetical protein